MAKIVFCEDDPSIQLLFEVALRATSHEVYVAGDGAAGLRLVEHEHPDAVFTDIAMPGIDGLELTRRIRGRDDDLAQIPVVLVTALQPAFIDQGYEAGATDHLTKPFTTTELRTKVEQHLGPPDSSGGDASPQAA